MISEFPYWSSESVISRLQVQDSNNIFWYLVRCKFKTCVMFPVLVCQFAAPLQLSALIKKLPRPCSPWVSSMSRWNCILPLKLSLSYNPPSMWLSQQMSSIIGPAFFASKNWDQIALFGLEVLLIKKRSVVEKINLEAKWNIRGEGRDSLSVGLFWDVLCCCLFLSLIIPGSSKLVLWVHYFCHYKTFGRNVVITLTLFL